MPQGQVIAIKPMGSMSQAELRSAPLSETAGTGSHQESRLNPKNWLVFIGYNSENPEKFIPGLTHIDTVIPYKGPYDSRRGKPVVNFKISSNPVDIPESAYDIEIKYNIPDKAGNLLLKAVLLVSVILGIGTFFNARR